MPIWTNGTRHVLFDETGIHILEDGVTRHIEDFTADRCDPEVFSVSPSGETIWLKLPSKNALKLELEDDITVVEYDWEPHAIVALNDNEIVVIYSDGEDTDAPLKIARGRPPQEEYQNWDHRLSMTEPVDVDWPDGLLPEQNLEVSDRVGLGSGRDLTASDLKLHSNFYGIAVVDKRAGLIGRIPAYGSEIDVTWRVPTSYDGILHAVCTNDGVMVAHGYPDAEGLISHFDQNGEAIDRRTFWNLGSVEMLDGGRAMVLAAEGIEHAGLQARILTLGTMADVRTFDLHFDGYPHEIDCFVDRDRRHCLLQGPGYVQFGQMKHNVWMIQDENFLSQFERAVREEDFEAPNYVPAEATEATRINFPVIEDAPEKWTFDKGETARLPVEIRSAGRPGEGIQVWVSGDAIEKGLFAPEFAQMGTAKADFVATDDSKNAYVATIEDAALPQGLEYPLDPKPKKKNRDYANGLLAQTHRSVEIVGTARESASALLRLEVAAVGQDAPIKWMRPFTVESGEE
jgi:hypothetical protein